MLHIVMVWVILIACYLCLAVIVFSPSIYAVWFYLVGARTRGNKSRLLNGAIAVFIVNATLAYVVFQLVFGHFLPARVAEKDALAAEAVDSAIRSQERCFSSKGHYYPVGPIRGPYRDEFGLDVQKDVILQVETLWDGAAGKEVFRAYAVHVWGEHVVERDGNGQVASSPLDSERVSLIKSKLIKSVK